MGIIENIKVQLFILFCCIALTLTMRINVESTGYTCADSRLYMRAADNYLNGKGFSAPTTYPVDKASQESYLAIFPIGYPVAIVAICYLTGLDSFVSSKLVNVIFLGFIFILLYHWFGSYSLLPACYFCSFGKLEIFSYTWSDGCFLFFLLWMLYLLERMLTSKKYKTTNTLQLIFCLVAIVCLRYVGLVYFFYMAALIGILYIQKKYELVKRLIFVISFSSLVIAGYLFYNYSITGCFFSCEPRMYPKSESWSYFLNLFFNGFINEFFLARNFYWTWDPLFLSMLLLQLLICFYVFKNRNRLSPHSFQSANIVILISSGLFYLIFIFFLGRIVIFDAFDYRILAPFSTPIFIAMLGNLKRINERVKINDLNTLIISFFILSMLMNLPKTFLLKWLGVL
jgi:hypothetical protein